MVAGAAGCACCVIFVAIALLLEPSFQSQSILPAATPLQAVEEIPAEEPFDLEALIAEYEQTTRARAQAAPVTVSIPPEQQLSLTMDSLKNYELASAPAGWTVDLSQLEGSGQERAAYCHDYINSDTIGWLQIPGTNIDYPVMRVPL